MNANIGIFDSTGARLYIGEGLLSSPQVDKGANGPRSCTFSIRLSFRLAVSLYTRLLGEETRISVGSATIFRGRIEDVKISTTGLQITAFGYWRALDDILYTAVWSTGVYNTWRPIQYSEFAQAVPLGFQFSTQNELRVAPTEGSVQGNTPLIGFLGWFSPDKQVKVITGIQFDYDFIAPVNWVGVVNIYTTTANVITGFRGNVVTLNGTAALQTGTIHQVLAGGAIDDVFTVGLYYNAAPAVYASGGVQHYLRIYNLRMVAATTNRVSTTYTAAAGGGNHNVGSTTGMYVGQRLHFSQGTVRGESAVITAINSSTQIAITLNKAHLAADTVLAHQIFADEIVKDIVSAANTQNANQLNSSTMLIQSPGIDLLEQTYADQRPSEILNSLAAIGDNASPPSLYEVGVDANKIVFFRPMGDNGQIYYVDVTDIETILTLSTVYNDIYARYLGTYEILVPGQNGNSGHYELVRFGALRTAKTVDQTSINTIGFKRTNFVDANTTASPLATAQRDTTLADSKNAQAKASIKFERVYNRFGGIVPLGLVNPGDTFIIRNYPFTLVSSTVIDRIKSFRILETSYDSANNTLTVTPENFVPTLGTLLRQRQLGLVSRRV